VEVAMACFNALSHHLLGGTEKTHEKVMQDSWPLDQETNPEFLEYETGKVKTLLQYLVIKLN
jgi:hypothetical protein